MLCGLGRGLLRAVLTWVAMSAAPVLAQAQPPIKLVVPATPGGSLDGMARTVAHYLAQISGQTVVVENRPGAAGIVGTDHVATSAPSGRTLLLAGSFIATNAPNYKAGKPAFHKLPLLLETWPGFSMAAFSGVFSAAGTAHP